MPAGVGYSNVMAPGSPRPRRPLKSRYDELIDEAEMFDPQRDVERSARGQFEAIRTPLAESIERLRGEQVGRGRLNTGFGFEDEDRLVRGAVENLNTQIASRAYQLPSMRLAGLGLRGELVSGGLDRELLREQMKRQRRGGLGGLLGAGLGAVAGSAIPGVGTLLGAKLGGMFGSAAGQYI